MLPSVLPEGASILQVDLNQGKLISGFWTIELQE